MIEEIQGYEVARLADPTPLQLVETIDGAEKANIDIQVSTAHAYPRSISRAVNNAIAIAVMDKETAQSCGYALPSRWQTNHRPIGASCKNHRAAIWQYAC